VASRSERGEEIGVSELAGNASAGGVDRTVAEAAEQLGGLHILVNSGSAPGGSPTATGPIETVIDEASSTSAAATPATPAISAAAPVMQAWCT
jgi:hypothetical protein